MLDTLSIKNFAIIEDIEINFHEGMNVLLGETGAGKSIIVEALSLLKGERSAFEKIRQGANKAFIEGRFIINDDNLVKALNEEYDDIIEDNELVVTRMLDTSGRSTIRLNGRMFSIAASKALMTEIIDIHSQNQNIMLFDDHTHVDLLDSYIGNSEIFEDYAKAYEDYLLQLKKLEELKQKTMNEEEVAYKKEQISEINEINIHVGELDELERIKQGIDSYNNVRLKYELINELIEGDNGVLSQLFQAKKELDTIDDNDDYSSRMNEAFYELRDINKSLQEKFEKFNNYYENIDEVNDRIFSICRLIKRYGQSEEDVLNAKNRLESEILLAEDHEYYLTKQEEVLKNALEVLNEKDEILSKLRHDFAKVLEQEVDKQLCDLALSNAHFRISIARGDYRRNGSDIVKFLMSTNVGTPFMPIKNIISGGESSRLMLGLKTIFSEYSNVQTIIFDEVDVGVSGKVASMVGKKIHEISKKRQVLLISHLAQVASYGDFGYRVEKFVESGKTKTTIKELNSEEFVEQIASLLSGSKVSELSLSAAKELIKEAHK